MPPGCCRPSDPHIRSGTSFPGPWAPPPPPAWASPGSAPACCRCSAGLGRERRLWGSVSRTGLDLFLRSPWVCGQDDQTPSLAVERVIHFCKSRGSNTIQTELCQTPPIQQQTVREQRAKRLAVNRPGSWLKCRLRDQGGALAGVRSSLSTSSGATYVCQEDPLTVRHSHKQKKQGAPKKEQEVCSADSPIAGGDAEKWGKKEKKRNATFNLQWKGMLGERISDTESRSQQQSHTDNPKTEAETTSPLLPFSSACLVIQGRWERSRVHPGEVTSSSQGNRETRNHEDTLTAKANDIEILFRHGSWKANGEFAQTDVHRQIAIVFKTPPYQDQDITEEVEVSVLLRRVSDQMESEPVSFTYLPHNPDPYEVKRKRATIKRDVSATEPAPSSKQTFNFMETQNVMSSDDSHLGLLSSPGSGMMDPSVLDEQAVLDLIQFLTDQNLPGDTAADANVFPNLNVNLNANYNHLPPDFSQFNDFQFNMLVTDSQMAQSEQQDSVMQVIDSAACCLVTPPTGVPRPRGTHRGNLPHLCVQAGCNHRSNYHYAETKAKLDEEGEREREKKNNLDARRVSHRRLWRPDGSAYFRVQSPSSSDDSTPLCDMRL
ncbi:hypothetical protein CCH79_00003873 [Gambusia affinis]|uniref:IPT/TIG domain-containing protein n=1 Tax=Gambusia affinis TaxID=33528 RepID=A0A315VC38_GAMAF|nr:hypothetical protein CCH79_00003873 [Gambusia affinis]